MKPPAGRWARRAERDARQAAGFAPEWTAPELLTLDDDEPPTPAELRSVASLPHQPKRDHHL